MRTTDKKKYLWMLPVFAALAGCQEEQPVDIPVTCPEENVTEEAYPYPQTPDETGNFFALYADAPAAVKVVLDSDKILAWEKDDAVSVWNGETFSKYVAQSAGTAVILAGEETDSAKDYYAYYPADETVAVADDSLRMTLPAAQVLVDGHFPYAPAVAYSDGTDRDFRFRSICGMVCFKITRADVNRMVISGADGEMLAGDVLVALADVEAPKWTLKKGCGKTDIVLTTKDGSPFVPGTYNVAILPQKFEDGIVIEMTNTLNQKAERVVSAPFELGRGQYLELGNVDLMDSWGVKYSIASRDEFLAFLESDLSNPALNVELAADIDMSGIENIETIKEFNGRFYGNGHRIMNWKMNGPFIDRLDGILSGLVFDASCSVVLPGNEDFAVIVRYNDGIIDGCVNHVDLSCIGVQMVKAFSVGGVVAVSTGNVTGCVNHGDITILPTRAGYATSDTSEGSKLYLGGVVGKVDCTENALTLSDCANHGSLTYYTEDYIKAQSFVGGVTGGTSATLCAALSSWTPYSNTLLRCTNTGDVKYGYENPVSVSGNNSNSVQLGGVVGYWEGNVTTASNSGKIDILGARTESGSSFLRGLFAGGVAGIVSGDISSAVNSGEIIYSGTTAGAPYNIVPCGPEDEFSLGGVVAVAGRDKGTNVTDCSNSGAMTLDVHMQTGNGTKSAVGGVVAHAYSNVVRCSNTADIDLSSYKKEVRFGGVAGFVASSFDVSSCSNSGDLTVDVKTAGGASQGLTLYAGGICGENVNGLIEASVNSGNIHVKGMKNGYVAGIVGNTTGKDTNNRESVGALFDCDNNAASILVDEVTGWINLGGIRGTVKSGTTRRVNNRADLTITKCAGNVKAAGIIAEQDNSGAPRIHVGTNSGNIYAAGNGSKNYIGGAVGGENGQVTDFVNTGDISFETAGACTYIGGLAGMNGAGSYSNSSSTSDITYTYIGTSVPELYIGLMSGYQKTGPALGGDFGGSITLNGVQDASTVYYGALCGIYSPSDAATWAMGNVGLLSSTAVCGVTPSSDEASDSWFRNVNYLFGAVGEDDVVVPDAVTLK